MKVGPTGYGTCRGPVVRLVRLPLNGENFVYLDFCYITRNPLFVDILPVNELSFDGHLGALTEFLMGKKGLFAPEYEAVPLRIHRPFALAVAIPCMDRKGNAS